ncbi:hypothetical protein [Geodermatophilus sp. URMC 64]
MNRIVAAARLHLVHPLVALGVPWLVVSCSFAISWLIWKLARIPDIPDSGNFTGGVAALYITVMIVYVQAVTQLLPFAMGLSLSRRTFYLGTALMGVAEALGCGVVLAVLTEVQRATGGWGVGLRFWAPAGLDVHNFPLQIAVSGAPMLAFMAAGVGMGAVYKRWGQSGVWGLSVGGILVLGGIGVLLTWLDAWRTVGAWFADQSVITLAVGLPLALAAVLGLLAFAGLRRAVP